MPDSVLMRDGTGLREDLSSHPWLAFACKTSAELRDDQVDSLLERMGQTERDRYEQTASQDAARRSLFGRALLRSLLGSYLGVEPAAVDLKVGVHGKPATQQASPAIHFNLSHCQSWLLAGLSTHYEIGVDVEAVGDFRPAVARRILAPSEDAAVSQLTDDQKAPAFYRLWTIKESCVKATGAGLSTPLVDVIASLNKTGIWRDVRWHVLDLEPQTAACVAIRPVGTESAGSGCVYTLSLSEALAAMLKS
jgi:phosphopantetheine--protein transferase-like protein